MKRHHLACPGAANLRADPPFGRTAGLLCWAVMLTLGPVAARAGPPFVTDDPEPVPYRHWELYHRTPTEVGEQAETAFNVGTVIDFTPHHHLLFSAGRSLDGPTRFQAYLAYQLTFGPHSLSANQGLSGMEVP